MAELNLGTSMSADDYLELVTAVNKRRNKSNAMLRGLGAIAGVTPTMRSDSGFDTSLRAYSKAKDEEILGKIMGFAADHNFPSENDYRDWYSEQGFPEKMYEKSAAEYRKRAGETGRVERLGISKAVESRAVQTQGDVRDVSSAGMSLANRYVGRWRGQSREIQQGILAEIQRDIDDSDVPQRLHSAVLEAVKKNLEQGGTMGAAYEKKIEMERAVRTETAKDMTKSMSVVAANAARDDITAIKEGADYDTVVQARIGTDESAGWEKENLEMYHSMMLESGLKPSAPTSAMKSQIERRGLVAPVSEKSFSEMAPEDQAKTRQNYLSLTQLVKSGQRQNVLLQGLTEGPMAKSTYDQINMIVDIEDPQFFQRVFEAANSYEVYAKFRDILADQKINPKNYNYIDDNGQTQLMTPEMIEEEFMRRAVRDSGWEPDHIYSLIRPEKFGIGVKYSRYRLGG